jgi:hypothetical protein
MATNNRLWGAERMRGDLLKLGIQVCKRTIEKYMRTVCPQKPRVLKVNYLRTVLRIRSTESTSFCDDQGS